MEPIVPLKERVHSIDIIRGFALCGVFLANIPSFFGNGEIFVPIVSTSDRFVQWLYLVLIDGKFITIFSLLFGLGFYYFMRSKQDHAVTLFLRRIGLLFVFGIAHYVLLWDGDVLHSYAWIGLILLLFHRMDHMGMRRALITVGTMYVLFYSFLAILMLMDKTGESMKIPFDQFLTIQGRWEFLIRAELPNELFYFLIIFTKFFIGFYAGKRRWFERVDELMPIMKKIWFGCFLIFFVFVWFMFIYQSNVEELSGDQLFGVEEIFTIPIATFYIISMLILIQRFGTRPFRYLQSLGKMALSNYILQTILSVLIVRTFVDTQSLPLWVGTLYGVVILSLQMILSHAYSKKFSYGWLEWLWRYGTYGAARMRAKR